jgi:hypothetical protein
MLLIAEIVTFVLPAFVMETVLVEELPRGTLPKSTMLGAASRRGTII